MTRDRRRWHSGQAQPTTEANLSRLQRLGDGTVGWHVWRMSRSEEDLMYPPENCTYEVTYRLGRRGHRTETFPDEYALGRWFREMTKLGAFNPVDFEMPDEDGRNGYQIHCVTDSGRIAISFRHPRLVTARINGRRRETASSNGAH